MRMSGHSHKSVLKIASDRKVRTSVIGTSTTILIWQDNVMWRKTTGGKLKDGLSTMLRSGQTLEATTALQWTRTVKKYSSRSAMDRKK